MEIDTRPRADIPVQWVGSQGRDAVTPIKPEDRHKYPSNWMNIRLKILERAGHKCEFCGVMNHDVGYRDRNGKFWSTPGHMADAAALDGDKIIKIVLTIAHIDHDPTNNDPENLKALCQKCHLNHDKDQHRLSRQKTRRKKLKIIDMFEGGSEC